MSIVTTVTESMFLAAFKAIRPDNFSREGPIALFECLNDMYDSDRPYELDVIAICCAMTEYADIAEYNSAYGTAFEEWDEVPHLLVAFGEGRAITQV
jgi:hypothetical protein